LEAKVALLELEKTRLSEDTARQAQAIQDLTDQKKSLDSELQEKKNLVIFKALHTLKDLPSFIQNFTRKNLLKKASAYIENVTFKRTGGPRYSRTFYPRFRLFAAQYSTFFIPLFRYYHWT